MAHRTPQLAQRAWDSLGNGALFTHRIRRTAGVNSSAAWLSASSAFSAQRQLQTRSLSIITKQPYTRPLGFSGHREQLSNAPLRRVFQTSSVLLEAQPPAKRPIAYKDEVKTALDPADEEESDIDTFKPNERASQASKINLSAKLSSEGPNGESKKGGRGEIMRLLRIARPELKSLSIAFSFLLVSSSVMLTVPFSIGKIMDAASQENATLFGLSMEQFYIALASLMVVGAGANFGRIVILRIVGERIVTKLRSQLFKKTFVQNAEFFDANRVGDLISRLGSDTIIVGKSITQNVSDGLRALVSASAGLTLMMYTSVKLTSVLAIFIPPIGIAAFLYGRVIRNLSRRIQKNLGTLTKIAEERLGNVRTSQAFAGELQEVHRYNAQVRKIFGLGRREAFIFATFFSTTGFMGNSLLIALLYVGGSMVQSGAISIGALTSFLMYAGYAGTSLFGLSSFYSELMKGVGAASRLFELQDRNPTISPTKGDMIRSARGAIEFKDVKFSYPTRPAVQIFEDLTFKIEPGSNVAIVAPSGAGKSTVASLLLRFYSPTGGQITIGGKDITTMNAKQLRRKIGYVGQEPVLFSGTIAENISYGKPLATKSEIVAAARQANCQFISDFPDGLETFVGARGTQLSGGQKQRIAIARALLKEPDILILDEATSALDAESETLVNQALNSLLQGQNTTISIAHRLSTIQRSDRIICIGADGKVAQTGPYAELAADKDGAFSKLMEWQMTGGSNVAPVRKGRDVDPDLTEEERMKARLEEHDVPEGEESSPTDRDGAKGEGR